MQLIPVLLLLAAANGFNEEIILRAAPIATVYEMVGVLDSPPAVALGAAAAEAGPGRATSSSQRTVSDSTPTCCRTCNSGDARLTVSD